MRGFAAASLELHQPLNTIFDAESDKMSNHREVIIMARTTSEFARQSVQSPLIRKSELRHFLFVIPKGYRRGNDGRLLCYFKLPMPLSTSTLQMSRSAMVEKREPCSVCHASVLGRPLHVDVPAPRQRDIQGKRQLPSSTRTSSRQGRGYVYRGEGTTNGGDFQTALVVLFSSLLRHCRRRAATQHSQHTIHPHTSHQNIDSLPGYLGTVCSGLRHTV